MNKGFSLIELTAVLVILSVLLLAVTIVVNPIVNNSEKNLSDIQIKNIEESAKAYYIKEGVDNSINGIEEVKNCVDVEELIEKGYIDKKEIYDFETEEKIKGSVKIIYRSNNYTYKYQTNSCSNYDKGIICERVKETKVGNVPEGNFLPGDAYTCKVDPNKEAYTFYVLSNNEDDTINLIMDRNICEDGSLTADDKEDNCVVAWYDKDEDNSYGPVTAMEYLDSATKNWSNVKNLNITYDDEGGHFTNFKISGKARLPYKSEVNAYDGSNSYLYQYLVFGGCYDNFEDFNEVACEDAGHIEGVYDENIIHMDNINAYWTLSSNINPSFAYAVHHNGYVDSSYVNSLFGGVRPVITLYKFQLE